MIRRRNVHFEAFGSQHVPDALGDPALVPPAIAQALAVREGAGNASVCTGQPSRAHAVAHEKILVAVLVEVQDRDRAREIAMAAGRASV